MSLIKVDPNKDWEDRNKLQLGVYRDFQGLNMTNSWWDNHWKADFISAETICPNLHFLDIETDPTVNNVYSNDSAVDGSRFQYNTLEKTPIKLHLWLQFEDYRDFIDKKHDIEAFFTSKAGYVLNTNFHPNIHARAYLNKIEIKPNGPNDAVFTITMDNPAGCWFTNRTSELEKDFDGEIANDIRPPRSLFARQGKPTWSLHKGMNHVWIGGDNMIKLSNPICEADIFLYNCQSGVDLINRTTKTDLCAYNIDGYDRISGDYVWMNLNFGTLESVDPATRAITYTPQNMLTTSTDFWLAPGWNDIELKLAESAYIDTAFYFNNF